MKRSKRTGRLLHGRRPVTTARPMHLTIRVHRDVGNLRDQAVLNELRVLLAEARRRGVKTVSAVLMPDHIHWLVVPESAEALRDATRYVFGKLAKLVNALLGRRGKVFVERYYSNCCRSVRQAFHALNYILKNAVAGGVRRPGLGPDPFGQVDEDVLASDRFLRSVVGPTASHWRALLARMWSGPVPFVPLAERCQARLPGL